MTDYGSLLTGTPGSADEVGAFPGIAGLSRTEVRSAAQALGLPAYRGEQAWRWVHLRMAVEWSVMTDLGPALQREMARHFRVVTAQPVETVASRDGTVRAVLQLTDGEVIESVYIPAGERRTVCVSSQVGCRWACRFCASGKSGFRRSLQAAEMVDQVRWAARHWGDRPTHVVFMGMGEPFDNYEAWIMAVRRLNDPEGLAIGARRITVSTAGVIPGIERLAGEQLQIELSVSLHAPDSELRSELMPINRRYPLPDLLKACRRYTEKTRRIITFEYTLIETVNDTRAHAQALARLLAGFPCRVNLIPLSPVGEYEGRGPARESVRWFQEILEKARINTTLRQSRGAEVEAACGQLRLRRLKQEGRS
jgi:23S rRNA (adenine2503-C2)-methyltransferase